MANKLNDVVLLGLRSITMTCGASLLRTALDGELVYKDWCDLLKKNAEQTVSTTRWSKALWWDTHWLSPPFAIHSLRAAEG